MKPIHSALAATLMLFSGCVSLTYQERRNLEELRAAGITIDKPVGNFEAPNSPAIAGCLQIISGLGNFYLATGRGGDTSQAVVGAVMLIFWPLSIPFAIPEGIIDAQTLNQREMLYYYRFDPHGKAALSEKGLSLD